MVETIREEIRPSDGPRSPSDHAYVQQELHGSN